MSLFPSEVPVVVVGAGPTGLTAANLLAAYGVDCLLLERDAGPMNLPRAIVIDDEGARTLQVFGLDRSYLADPMEGDGSRYYDDAGHCFAETGQGPRNFGFAKRNFIFQPELEAALRARLEDQAPATLRFGAEVTAIEQAEGHAAVVVAGADGREHRIRTQWVLACDGGRSPIRESLGIPMSGNTYEEDWIVVDTLNDPDQSLFSKFFCSDIRPTVSVPAPAGGRRYEFMLLPGETREQVLQDGFLESLMAPLRPWRPADILRRTVYTFHARMAERFRHGRIMLMGDAAHLTPPFAGQGMNAGLRDAHNVTWKLACMIRGGAGDVMDSYADERRKPAWDMIQLAVAMGSIVMPAGRDQVMFRDLLLKALEPFPNVRDYLIQMRFKPKPRYETGLFLGLEAPAFDASLVGEMIPQPLLAGGGRLDDRLGPGFALIAQDAAGAAALEAMTQDSFLGLPLARVQLDTCGIATGLALADPGVARPLRTHRDQVLLVRPDRYCAAAFAPEDIAAALADYAARFAGAQDMAKDRLTV
ncbi:bifunctional 3-(3-hydroxy-phenyl)propionate/3-hydroxycinnamic acid hydroxylase [Pseudooceanicola sp. 216_PA32_1]|uniref:Bifunctional 3-(3-hydroxy-phenyl)propionate/3-hydroxycinnamic acid hydroxylase n=1 Tax=Pseudooceanicola pacificus TaxID=2676438 RepID=A0A844W7K0_9RHOB|nr:bifunctional 3-(3-hydroxy-phenyl)propionate/3-hydroxycinnamic acid hydroxylase [Pseudooceanicola pacificus]MWB79105.1 bifunctional 3-(3-hydroxy-phenyl)propionate/3-hydroxycinnamic acid hydroxylase [Pseudooceanicola pacificus]